MVVFIKDSNGIVDTKPIDFEEGHEGELENLIIDNPEIFPVKDFSGGASAKWIPITKQLHLETGYLDTLGIDDEGTIYIIENKLSVNPDKKTVRQQVSDYAFGLLDLKEYFDGWKKFCEKIENANKSKTAEGRSFHNKSLEEIIKENVDADSFDECWDGVKTNFDAGHYTLVVAMNRIPRPLRIAIDGQNEIDEKHKYPLFALEVNEFQGDSDKTIIVTSTYPFDLDDLKRKKSQSREVYENNMKRFQEQFEDTFSGAEEQRKIFDDFRVELEKISRTEFNDSVTVKILPRFDNYAATKSPIVLVSNGDFKFQFDKLKEYEHNAGPGRLTNEARELKEKMSMIPEIKKVFDEKPDNVELRIKPEIWLPHQKQMLKIIKEVFVESDGS